MKTRQKLWLIASFLVAALLLVSCTGQVHVAGMKSLRPLTDAEKEKVTELALNTPEALQAKDKYGSDNTSLGWMAIDWKENTSVRYSVQYDYQRWEEWISENVPASAEWYSRVEIEFGEPPELLLRVAVNPETGKVGDVLRYGLKESPAVSENTTSE